MPDPHVFAGNPLDRAADRRRDPAWLKARIEEDSARFLPLWRLRVLVKTGATPALAWARREILATSGDAGALFLGLREGVAHFALDVSGLADPDGELGLSGAARFEEVRGVAGSLAAEEAGVVAQARSLVDWHARHRFCPACGGGTRAAEGGWQRRCADCNAEHFPRTDPVVIMLVHRGGECLLGRQRGWPPGMFSALAGFVEHGETIEEAVRREVLEEVGVPVDDVSYHSSQPWPFPASLMIGCLARGTTGALRIDPHELDDARWFPRERVRDALRPGGGGPELFVPPPMAIAHHLIRAWAQDG